MIKDLVYMIAEKLEDDEVINLSLISKYYNKIINENFWKKRFFSKNEITNTIMDNIELNIYNESWKKYYFMVKKIVTDENHIGNIKFIIDEDRSDLLIIFYKKHGYHYNMNIYDWNNNVGFINPLDHCIKKDSIKCFKVFKEFFPISNFLNSCIIYDSHKIIEHLLDSEYPHPASDIIIVLNKQCETCAKLLEKKNLFDMDVIIKILYTNSYIVDNIINGNKIFSYFVKKIPREKMEKYKNDALERNRFDVIKCLTMYTMPF